MAKPNELDWISRNIAIIDREIARLTEAKEHLVVAQEAIMSHELSKRHQA